MSKALKNTFSITIPNGETEVRGWENSSKEAVFFGVDSDQDITIYADFKHENNNSETSSSLSFYPRAGIYSPHILQMGGENRFFRLRIENNSGSDASVNVVSSFGIFPQLTAPNNLSLTQDADASTVRPSDFRYEIAQGLRRGYETWNKFGFNEDIDTGGEEIVAAFGGTFTILSSSGDTLDVVSDSSEDAVGGTGSSSIQIVGVLADGSHGSEIITLTGLTPVTTSSSFRGINRVQILSSGSNQANVGDITITASTGGSVQALVPAEESVTEQCIFHVGENFTFLADYLFINVNKISGGGSPRVTVKAWVYSYTTNSKYEVFRYTIDTGVENTVELSPSQPFIIGENQVLYFTAETNVSNTIASVRFSGVLIENIRV